MTTIMCWTIDDLIEPMAITVAELSCLWPRKLKQEKASWSPPKTISLWNSTTKLAQSREALSEKLLVHIRWPLPSYHSYSGVLVDATSRTQLGTSQKWKLFYPLSQVSVIHARSHWQSDHKWRWPYYRLTWHSATVANSHHLEHLLSMA